MKYDIILTSLSAGRALCIGRTTTRSLVELFMSGTVEGCGERMIWLNLDQLWYQLQAGTAMSPGLSARLHAHNERSFRIMRI